MAAEIQKVDRGVLEQVVAAINSVIAYVPTTVELVASAFG